MAQSVRAFIAAWADRLIDPTIPPPGEGELLTVDMPIQRQGPGPRKIIGVRSVAKSTRFTSINLYDTNAGTLEAITTGPVITFRTKDGGATLQGVAALAGAEEVFGRVK